MAYHSPTALSYEFTNKYGTVILAPITHIRPVLGLRWEHVPPECHVSSEDAARVTLITENRHVQPMFEVPMRTGGDWAFSIHTSPSEIRLTKVLTLNYTGPTDGHNEIYRVNKLDAPFMYDFM